MNFEASPILLVPGLTATINLVSPTLHVSCTCSLFYFILFLVQERKKPSLNWHPILLRPPAAVATPTHHPLPGRQHLIKMARKLCPLPRRTLLGLGGGGGEASRLHSDSWYSGLKTTAKWILYG